MLFRATRFALAAMVPIAMAGCDQTTEPETSLSAQDAQEVALAMDGAAAAAVDAQAGGAATLSLSPSGEPSLEVFTRTRTFTADRACPIAGGAEVAGTHTVNVDTSAGSIELTLEADVDYAGCEFRTGEGVKFTIDGTVALDALRSIARGGPATGSQSYVGTLDYTADDGRAGTCAIDVTTSFSAAIGNATRTVVGSVCGHAVDVTDEWRRDG
jgi:hypothetical protein